MSNPPTQSASGDSASSAEEDSKSKSKVFDIEKKILSMFGEMPLTPYQQYVEYEEKGEANFYEDIDSSYYDKIGMESDDEVADGGEEGGATDVEEGGATGGVESVDGQCLSGDVQDSGDNKIITKTSKFIKNYFDPRKEIPKLDIPATSYHYQMKHSVRGRCLIFNNEFFEKYKTREGTNIDSDLLESTFNSLNFNVKPYKDRTADEVKDIVRKAAAKDYSDMDCFVCCILTHGAEGGVLRGAKGSYFLDDVVAFFTKDKCSSLNGKPKIFIVNACRGDRRDEEGARVRHKEEADSGYFTYRIPSHADILVAHSCRDGYCDLLQMLTIVNQMVAYDYPLKTKKDAGDCENASTGRKQIPCVVHTLTRLIKFSTLVPQNESESGKGDC